MFEWLPVDGTTRYYIQVSQDQNFANPRLNLFTTYTSGNITQYRWARDILPKNTVFYWRVNAYSATHGTGNWSTVGSFKSANQPLAPTLLSPAVNARLATKQPTMTWSLLTRNVNEPNAVEFEVQIASDPYFNTLLHTKNGINGSTFSYQPASVISHSGNAYWRVRAKSEQGHWGPWAAARRFIFPSL